VRDEPAFEGSMYRIDALSVGRSLAVWAAPCASESVQGGQPLREARDEHDRKARIAQGGGGLQQQPTEPPDGGPLEAWIVRLCKQREDLQRVVEPDPWQVSGGSQDCIQPLRCEGLAESDRGG
jgi:hypothetical protein